MRLLKMAQEAWRFLGGETEVVDPPYAPGFPIGTFCKTPVFAAVPKVVGIRFWQSRHSRLTITSFCRHDCPPTSNLHSDHCPWRHVRLVVAKSPAEALLAIVQADLLMARDLDPRKAILNAIAMYRVVRISAPDVRLADLRDHPKGAVLGHRLLHRSAPELVLEGEREIRSPDNWTLLRATLEMGAAGAIMRDPSRRTRLGEEIVIWAHVIDALVEAGAVQIEEVPSPGDLMIPEGLDVPSARRARRRLRRFLAGLADEIGWGEPDLELRRVKRELFLQTVRSFATSFAILATPIAAGSHLIIH